MSAPHRKSPVMNTNEAAAYVRRSPNAMKILRHRDKGPDCFQQDGRIYYYVTELDRWLAAGAAADPRSNRDPAPTQIPQCTRRSRSSAAAKTPAKTAA